MGLDSTTSPPPCVRKCSIHTPLNKARIVQEVMNRADLLLRRDVSSIVGRAALSRHTKVNICPNKALFTTSWTRNDYGEQHVHPMTAQPI